MQLSNHTDIGLRTLMLLATTERERVSAAEIAAFHDLSFAHVQKVVQSLQAAGFVHTTRGRGGGVSIAKRSAEIRVGDVVRALEPSFNMADCFRSDGGRCRLKHGCGLTGVLREGRDAMLAAFDAHTLADVVRRSTEPLSMVPSLTGAED